MEAFHLWRHSIYGGIDMYMKCIRRLLFFEALLDALEVWRHSIYGGIPFMEA